MSAPIQGSFGQLLRRYRLAAGYSQERLATLSELGVRTIADLECGVSRYPHPHTVEALAQALHLTGATRASFASAARRPGSSASQHQEQRPTTDTGAPVFVGRASELAAGDRFLAGDGPSVLLFAGEPGIGKSRLLRELAVQARGAGWRVVAGGCDQRSGREPYAPFVETLDDSLCATPPSRRKGDLKECDWLARLGPELAVKIRTPVPEWSLTPEQERRMIFAAVRRYLVNIAGPAGTLLILDDLQWAGLDALDLLAFLVRTRAIEPPTDASPHAALRVLGAYRTSEVQSGHPLENLIVDLAHDERLSLYELARLSEGEARLLATGLVDGAPGGEQWITDMVARSDGMPFYLVNYAQAFVPGIEATPLADQSGSLTRELKTPWLVTATIRRRLAALPPEAQETLALAAIIGRVAPLDLLRLARKSSGDEVASSLEVACRARLLEEVGPTVGYRFTHDLIRETVFASLSQARQALLHLAVADTLEQLPPAERARHVAALADHLMQAGEPARALPYVLLAGDQAEAVYAHAEAEGQYRTALRITRELGDQAREAEALEKLAHALNALRRFNDALEIATQGVAVCGALGDIEAEAQMAWLLGRIHYFGRGTPEEGIVQLAPLVGDLRQRGASPRAVIHLQLVLILLWEDTGKNEAFGRVAREALATAEQVLAFARTAQDSTLLTDALGIVSRIAGTLGNYEAEFLALEEAVALDAPTGEAWSQTVIPSVSVYVVKTLAYFYSIRGRFAESRPLYERAVGEAIRDGNPGDLESAQRIRGLHLFLSGDWAQARSDFEQAVEITRKSQGVSGQALSFLFLLNVVEGRAEEEPAELVEMLARQGKGHHYDLACNVQSPLAERDLLSGSVESARERLQPLLEEHLTELDEDNLISVLISSAWVNLMLGETARAEERLAESRSRIEATGWRLWLVDALRVEALIRIAQQRWAEAEAALDETLELTRALPYPYAEVKALWVYGQLETARGDPAAARERFKEALAICDRLGEGLYRKCIERDLAALE